MAAVPKEGDSFVTEVVLDAVKFSHEALRHASDAMWTNLEILAAAVKAEGLTYRYNAADEINYSYYGGIWKDVRAKDARERVASIQLPEPSAHIHRELSPKEFAYAWLLKERLKIRNTKAGLTGSGTPLAGVGGGGVVASILEFTSWMESAARAKELGECSELIEALAAKDGKPWWEWLTNHRENVHKGSLSAETGRDET